MRKGFAYRLYPTPKQTRALEAALDESRWLYNQLLEERKNAFEQTGKGPTLYEQHARLPALKAERPSLHDVHSQVLQNVAVRIDLAMKAFFRRVQAGEKPGFPRFRGRHRYDSLTFPQVPSGCQLVGGRLRLSKIGDVRIKLHRPLEGKPKTCTIHRASTGKWYASFSCEVPVQPQLPPSEERVGIDVGLTSFATLSTGEIIANPRFFRTEEKALAKASRRLNKEAKGTAGRERRRRVVARIHERIGFRRRDFAHQTARKIVNRFGFIAVEDLEVNRLVHNHCLAKSIADAAWALFFVLLFGKAEEAGRTAVKINPAYTSQDCSRCHHRQKLPLSERTYQCPCCGLEIGRDHNAALNILSLGSQAVGIQPQEAAPL